MPQKEIQKAIDLEQLIIMDFMTGFVKVPSTGEYVGFRLHEPYNYISHGLSPESAENLLCTYRLQREQKKQEKEYLGAYLNYNIGW